MANYGKALTLFGVISFIIGAILMSTLNGPEENGRFDPRTIPLILGGISLVIGLPRLVQGANPYILGQMIRPKAAARSSIIWAIIIFNLTPFYFAGSRILDYGPPFPSFIFFSGYFLRPNSGLTWMPAVFIIMVVLTVLGLILSGKFPKTIRIIFNAIMVVCFVFWLNFGIQMTLWSFLDDKSNLFFAETFGTGTEFKDLLPWIITSTAVSVFSIIMVIRMLNQLTIAFSQLDIKTAGAQVAIFTTILTTFIVTVLPIYYGVEMCLQNDGYIFPFLNYIGLIYVAILLFKLITSVLSLIREFSRQKTGAGSVTGEQVFGFNTAIFLVIIFIAWAPIFLPLVDRGMNMKNHSVYNPNWNGSSNFKSAIEAEGYETMCIQSSFSVITRLDPSKQIILVTLGPNVMYNPASEVPFFLTAFKSNFSMFICDDHGTVESLLFEMFIASLGQTPLTFIPNGILRDNSSYWKNPAFPVITQFSNHPVISGTRVSRNVNSVCLSYGSGFLGGEFLAALGWSLLGMTSGDYSFIDVDNDGAFNQSIDKYTLQPTMSETMKKQETEIGLLGSLLEMGLPLGGYPQGVFAIKDVAINQATEDGEGYYSSRIFCSTDASWLNNELTTLTEKGTTELMFDNLNLGLNVIDYLACGRDPEDCIVIFDEAHIRPTSGITEVTSAATFGRIQGYINWLSTNPILSLVYPLFALYSLRRWIPAEENKKTLQLKELLESEKNMERLKFRTSSFFSRKINWYRINKRYKQALSLLYRRLERKIRRLLGDNQATVENIVNAIVSSKGKFITPDILKRIQVFFTKMTDLKANKLNIADEEEFQNMFLEMQWIADNI